MYWDLTVFLNFLVDYLLLFAAARLSGTYAVHWRLLAAATLGGSYAGGCLLPGFEFLGALPWRIVFLALMAMLAYGLRRSTWQQAGLFLLLSFSLGGMAQLAAGEKPGKLLLCAGLLWLACTLLLRGRAGPGQYIPLEISGNGTTVRLTALRDTGNTLCDPVTGEPVLVVDRDAGCALTGLTAQQLSSPIETITSQTEPGLRLIPYHAVGQAEGFLLARKIPDVILGGKRRARVVAFAPNRVGGAAYQALIGGSV